MHSKKSIYQTANKLEFPKIISILKSLCFCEYGRKKLDEYEFCFEQFSLNEKLDQVAEMIDLLHVKGFSSLTIYDIDDSLKLSKIKDSYLPEEELNKIRYTFSSIRKIKNTISENKSEYQLLFKLADNIFLFTNIEESIAKAIDNNNKIIPKASKKLHEIVNEIENIHSLIDKKLNSIFKNNSYKNIIQENIITLRQDRFVIPIKKDYKGKIPGIILDVSNTGETLFLEPQSINELNNKYITLKNEEKVEQIRILKSLTNMIYDKWSEINHSISIISIIDEIYAKARYSIKNRCTRPHINSKRHIKIIQARHPLINNDIVVPIDIIIGQNYDILILTGPNTGGKTVSLKTLGILTIMTLFGMHIPAKNGSEVYIIDDIFIDVGDEQSIEQNLSTFSSHIKRISYILRKATSRSLILIDELGAGTDPREGGALSISILEYLSKYKYLTWITTHLSDVKSYFLRSDNIETATCLFDEETLSPKYKIIYGIIGSSNAIIIAKKLNLLPQIIEKAEEILISNVSDNDKVINDLLIQKEKYISIFNQYEELVNETKLMQEALAKKEELIKNKEYELQKKEKELRQKEFKESKELVRDTRKQLNQLIKNIKTFEKNEIKVEHVKEALAELEVLNIEINQEAESTIYQIEDDEIIHSFEEFSVGQHVFIKSISKYGNIIELNDKKSEISVMVGDIKIYTTVEDLSIVDRVDNIVKDQEAKFKKTITYSDDENLPYELYLLGMRGEDAVKMCEKYIDNLYVQGREKGRIVHGIGEGILRKLISQLLTAHPHVESYYSPSNEPGGYGVTEVILRK